MRAGNCSPATIESLISINNQLGHRDSAVGILRFAQQQGVCAPHINLIDMPNLSCAHRSN